MFNRSAYPLFAVPCRVPFNAYAAYRRFSVEGLSPEDSLVTEETDFIDGDTVNFTCSPGFNIKGPSSFTCILGEWDVPVMPECTPGKSSTKTTKLIFGVTMI